MKSGFDAGRARSKGQRDGKAARTGAAPGEMAQAILDNLRYRQAKLPEHATLNDWYMALAYTVRDRMLDHYIETVDSLAGADRAKVVAYLSAEFLTGPHLGNGLVNLGLWDAAKEAVASVGQDFAALLEHEEEPGLGNGGLGRLAACYMDSLATLNVPAIGYGIRYEFGIFDQAIRDGWQVELTDKWLRFGNPWEIVRSETSYDVPFGGRTDWYWNEAGQHRVRWVPDRVVKGIAYDTPVPGYRVASTNLLRLWKAEATESFDFDAFNVGDYYGAVDEKIASETISKVLYPNDEPEAGKRLRLQQQYFFVSCSLQDMIRLHLAPRRPARRLRCVMGGSAQRHPSRHRHRRADAAVRRHARAWPGSRPGRSPGGRAPTPTTRSWRRRSRNGPVPLFGALLPRHLEIILEINRRLLDAVRRRYPGDDALVAPPVDHRRDGRAVRPHGQPGVGRQPCHQRRGGAPHRAAQADGAERLPHDRARQVLQRHQRRHAAPLAGAEQPPPERADHRPHRRSVDRRPGARAGAPGTAGHRPRLPAGLAGGQGREQGRARRAAQGADRHGGRSAIAVRRPGEAAPRIQAPAPQRAVPRDALQPAETRDRRLGSAAHRDLRRQGRAWLSHGQADHPADHRRRRGRQRRPEGVGPSQGRLPPGFQRQDQSPRLSRGRPVGAALDWPARRRRARAT